MNNELSTEHNPDCAYCVDEFCVNDDCPYCADYCPVDMYPEICRHYQEKA